MGGDAGNCFGPQEGIVVQDGKLRTFRQFVRVELSHRLAQRAEPEAEPPGLDDAITFGMDHMPQKRVARRPRQGCRRGWQPVIFAAAPLAGVRPKAEGELGARRTIQASIRFSAQSA